MLGTGGNKMKIENKKGYLASVALLLAAIFWGLGFVVVKNSLESIPAIYILAFRFSVASLCMLLIFHKKLRGINKIAVQNGIVLGSLIFFGYYVQTIGCAYTTAGKNAFLTTVYVVAVPFLHWFLSKKRPDIFCMLAAFTAIIGIGFLSLDSKFTMNIGDLLSLICGIGYAFHMIFIDKYTKSQDPILLTVIQVFVATALSWITAVVTRVPFPAAFGEANVITSMLYLGIFSSMLAFLLQNVGQKYTAPSTAAILLSMESVFGVFFSVLFLKELVTARMFIGCALILIAVIMAETKFEFITNRILSITDKKVSEEMNENS